MDAIMQRGTLGQSLVVSKNRWWVWAWKRVLAVSDSTANLLSITAEQLEKWREDFILIKEELSKAGIIYKGNLEWDFTNAKWRKYWPEISWGRNIQFFPSVPILKQIWFNRWVYWIENLMRLFKFLWFEVVDNNKERRLKKILELEVGVRNEILRALLIEFKEEFFKVGIIHKEELIWDFSGYDPEKNFYNIRIHWRRLVVFPSLEIIREACIWSWEIICILSLIKMFEYLWFTVIDSKSETRKWGNRKWGNRMGRSGKRAIL